MNAILIALLERVITWLAAKVAAGGAIEEIAKLKSVFGQSSATLDAALKKAKDGEVEDLQDEINKRL